MPWGQSREDTSHARFSTLSLSTRLNTVHTEYQTSLNGSIKAKGTCHVKRDRSPTSTPAQYTRSHASGGRSRRRRIPSCTSYIHIIHIHDTYILSAPIHIHTHTHRLSAIMCDVGQTAHGVLAPLLICRHAYGRMGRGSLRRCRPPSAPQASERPAPQPWGRLGARRRAPRAWSLSPCRQSPASGRTG